MTRKIGIKAKIRVAISLALKATLYSLYIVVSMNGKKPLFDRAVFIDGAKFQLL